jgi:uncharacterized protein (TIGR02246 family)
MNSNAMQIVSEIVNELEKGWNAADGAGFARPFAEDADFVNIRGEHFELVKQFRKATRRYSTRSTKAVPYTLKFRQCVRWIREFCWLM